MARAAPAPLRDSIGAEFKRGSTRRIVEGPGQIEAAEHLSDQRNLPRMGEFLSPRRRRPRIPLMRHGQSAMASEIETCLTRFILTANCSSKSTTTCACSIRNGSSPTVTALHASRTNCDLLNYSELIGLRPGPNHHVSTTQATSEAQ